MKNCADKNPDFVFGLKFECFQKSKALFLISFPNFNLLMKYYMGFFKCSVFFKLPVVFRSR